MRVRPALLRAAALSTAQCCMHVPRSVCTAAGGPRGPLQPTFKPLPPPCVPRGVLQHMLPSPHTHPVQHPALQGEQEPATTLPAGATAAGHSLLLFGSRLLLHAPSHLCATPCPTCSPCRVCTAGTVPASTNQQQHPPTPVMRHTPRVTASLMHAHARLVYHHNTVAWLSPTESMLTPLLLTPLSLLLARAALTSKLQAVQKQYCRGFPHNTGPGGNHHTQGNRHWRGRGDTSHHTRPASTLSSAHPAGPLLNPCNNRCRLMTRHNHSQQTTAAQANRPTAFLAGCALHLVGAHMLCIAHVCTPLLSGCPCPSFHQLSRPLPHSKPPKEHKPQAGAGRRFQPGHRKHNHCGGM